MKPRADEEQALWHLRLLDLPLHELRCIRLDEHRKDRIQRGWFTDRQLLAETAAGLSEAVKGDVYGGVYVTVNELDPMFKEFVGQEMASGAATRAEHVICRRNLIADIDPNKPEGLKAPASDTEHNAVLAALQKVKAIHLEHGLPEPALIDSGNGGYPISKIDLPNDEESEALVQRYFAALAKLIDNDLCHVDQTVFNPDRIFRLAGTINRKGTETADRPFRSTCVISEPQQLAVVTKEQLLAFTGKVLGSDWVAPVPLKEREKLPKEEYDKRVAIVVEYLRRAGRKDIDVVRKADGTAINFTGGCPFKDAGHKTGGSGVFVFNDGHRIFSCFHEKCHNKRTFADLEKHLKLKFQDVASEFATSEQFGDDTKRVFYDPTLLAQQHLKRWMKDGSHSLAFFRDETYRYDIGGWETISDTALEPWIRATVEESFMEHAKILSRLTGEDVRADPIRGFIVRDVYKAMQMICRHEIAREAQAPFWLVKHEWNPDDLFVFRNGILNVRRYVNGEDDYWMNPTPKLFYLHAAGYDFIPKADPPKRWLGFLESLRQSADWVECLQQVMGYLLWAGYDLQKYFQLIGPTRAGKGISSGVCEGLQGGAHSSCSLDIENFGTQFGLEDAVNKRLAILSEATVPSKDVKKCISRFKAVTGGDIVPVNRKNLPQISVKLNIKILMHSNEFLVLPDTSGAIHARTLPLKFTESFRGKEDKTLAVDLMKEYPSIFNWAIEGIRSLLANEGKFTLPESTQAELAMLRTASSPIEEFVSECCEINGEVCCTSTSLYRIYFAWHQQNRAEEEALAENTFADQLRQAAPAITKDRMSTAGVKEVKGHKLVETSLDSQGGRASVWLKIMPKPEWRSAV